MLPLPRHSPRTTMSCIRIFPLIAVLVFAPFARIFRDSLGWASALFLDGTISSLYTGDPAQRVIRFPLGPIIGIVEESF